MNFANQVKNTLLQDIADMAKVSWMFSKHPGKDFTRKRKIDFQSLLHFSICMEAGTLRHELLKYFSYDPSTLSNSAFYQPSSSTPISQSPYTRRNTAFLPPMALPLLLPEIPRIRNLISLRTGKPQMGIIRFTW